MVVTQKTRTSRMTTMTTTTTQTITTRRWLWSGETEEPDYSRWNDDEEQTTYEEYQQMLKEAAWRDYAHSCDDNEDDDDCPSLLPAAVAAQQQHVQPVQQHVPFMNLTKEERDKKSDQFKFGLCAHCDAGLDDESDFVCEPRGLGCSWVMACNACHEYYRQLAYLRVVDDQSNGGCN
jgi:hypothetical protein